MSESQATEPGKISSESVYQGRIVKLFKDTVRYPNGATGVLEIIRHPGASAIVPLLGDLSDEDPEILLIRQYRYAAGGYIYEIPAGMLEPGEAPEACAVRELKEETGCTAEKLEHLFSLLTTPGFTDEKIELFLATGLERGETAHESDEFLTVEPVTISTAVRFVQQGEIRDGKTAIGIMLAAALVAARREAAKVPNP